MSIARAELVVATIVVAAVLRAAPHAAVVPPEYPHKEGRQAVVLEVEGAPSAQATRAGEGLPAVDQDHVPRGGDLGTNPRSSTAAPISLQLEAIKP